MKPIRSLPDIIGWNLMGEIQSAVSVGETPSATPFMADTAPSFKPEIRLEHHDTILPFHLGYAKQKQP